MSTTRREFLVGAGGLGLAAAMGPVRATPVAMQEAIRKVVGSNPVRIETTSQAALLDRKLFELWSRHPRFSHVPNSASFFKKISAGLEALQKMVHTINGKASATNLG